MKRADLNVERWMNVVLTIAHELYDKLLNIGKSQYYKLKRAHKKRTKVQSMPENLPIGLYLGEDINDLPPMLALEGEEEVKLEPDETVAVRIKLKPRKKNTGAGLKTLTQNKLLTILSILLAQIKAGNNSYELKNEIRQILYLLYHHNKISKKV